MGNSPMDEAMGSRFGCSVTFCCMNSPPTTERQDPAWIAALERVYGVEAPTYPSYLVHKPSARYGLRFRALMEVGEEEGDIPIVTEGFDYAACDATEQQLKLERANAIAAKKEGEVEQAWIDLTTQGLNS